MSHRLELIQENDALHQIRFTAMASPCQVLLDHTDWTSAAHIAQAVYAECLRIEQKYSRYRNDSFLAALHRNTDCWFDVDEETAKLFDFSEILYQLSEKKFDITSGVLGKIWHFDGSEQVPTIEQINQLLPHIGWDKVKWKQSQKKIYLPQGMSLDFGGIGKEYAVDRCAEIIEQLSQQAYLVNFGGDLRARGPRKSGLAWRIGLETPEQNNQAQAYFDLNTGAIATSGDSKRYLFKDGVRYSHILNPLTGASVKDAPRSITVYAQTCIQAGMLATLAMLEGAGAKQFLAEQSEGQAWIID